MLVQMGESHLQWLQQSHSGFHALPNKVVKGRDMGRDQALKLLGSLRPFCLALQHVDLLPACCREAAATASRTKLKHSRLFETQTQHLITIKRAPSLCVGLLPLLLLLPAAGGRLEEAHTADMTS
jgi:hypothetical protein